MQAHLANINLYQCDRSFATGERLFDFPYLLYVHKGLGSYRIGSVTHTGAMGDLFYCPAGIGNTIIADGSDPFLLSGMDFSFVGTHPVTGLLPKVNLLSNAFLVSLINQMVAEFSVGRIHSPDICNSLLTAMLYELLRFSKIGSPGEESTHLKLLDYLKNNAGRTVGSGEMASVFSYHKSSINRIITAATGMSPREYQIATRIRMAEELLAYSSRPLGEIAVLCGYMSPVFFSRQFREKTGCTPGAYRRARQKSD